MAKEFREIAEFTWNYDLEIKVALPSGIEPLSPP